MIEDPLLHFWLTVALAGFLGFIIGAYAEARLWRGKATTGFRMASGGKLYRITEE